MLVLAFAAQASADQIRFCIHINAEYSDSCRGPASRDPDGFCSPGAETEDYWADRYFDNDFGSLDYPRPLTVPSDRVRFQAFRGGYVQIYERTSSRCRRPDRSRKSVDPLWSQWM